MDRMSKIFVGLLSAATLPGCGQDSIALEDAQREPPATLSATAEKTREVAKDPRDQKLLDLVQSAAEVLLALSNPKISAGSVEAAPLSRQSIERLRGITDDLIRVFNTDRSDVARREDVRALYSALKQVELMLIDGRVRSWTSGRSLEIQPVYRALGEALWLKKQLTRD